MFYVPFKIICIWNEVKVRIIIIFSYGYVIVLATLVGEYVPSSLTCLDSVIENKWTIHMKFFYYTLFPKLLIDTLSSKQYHTVTIFVTTYKVLKSGKFSDYFFKTVFVILDPIYFQITFRVSLSVTTKSVKILHGIVLSL